MRKNDHIYFDWYMVRLHDLIDYILIKMNNEWFEVILPNNEKCNVIE